MIIGNRMLLDNTVTLLEECINRIRVWRVELVGVIQSTKPDQKDTTTLDSKSEIEYIMVTLRNLILTIRHAWVDNQIGLFIISHFNTISEMWSNILCDSSERRAEKQVSKNLRYTLSLNRVTTSNSLLQHKERRVSIKEMARARVLWETGRHEKFYSTEIRSSNRIISVVPNIMSISDINNLVLAYELIKSKPGNMTKGSDEQTLDGISMDWIKKISIDLKNGIFKFRPGRQVLIPKPGKSEKRKLIIAGPREKVVQKAIEIIFNSYFDPLMSNNSHGFRPSRGVRTAILQVDSDLQSSKFVVEGDLRKAFDSIPHDKLMLKLKEHIKCIKTLKLIESLLEAGYYDGKTIVKTKAGVPQGSVISPLLCNIYLTELDNLLKDIKEKYNKTPNRSAKHPDYNKIACRMGYIKRNIKKLGDAGRQEITMLRKKLLRIPSKTLEKVNITYVRYADDFVIGVEGPKSLAIKIREEVGLHLETMGLEMNMEKTRITDFEKDPITFLGFNIKSVNTNEKAFEVLFDKKIGRKITRRKKVRLSFEFDYHKILDKLKESGTIRLRIRKTSNDKNDLIHRGRFRGNLMHLDHPDILNYYNSIVRGIYNYYCICRNHNQLYNILWLIKESCALTLARKFKMRTMKKVFSKFGKDLAFRKKVTLNGKDYLRVYKFFSPVDTKKVKMVKWAPTKSRDELIELMEEKWNNKLTRSNLWEVCSVCGADSQIEMHHLRSIKDLRDPKGKNKDWFTRALIGINRKQVPLCRVHHEKLHNNKLDIFEITSFRNYLNKAKDRHISEFAEHAKAKLILQEKNTMNKA